VCVKSVGWYSRTLLVFFLRITVR